uniref:Uncharacterized protein n=1 Tax=Avena sativa TaxID=4498 RepID=A0ACD5Z8Y4_AVESA
MALPWLLRHLWERWSIQMLVLLSLGLQVALLVLAGIRRRRGAHYMLRFLLWLAYQLADYTATYALGHLSIMAMGAGGHPSVGFWAPFLLLHLGGPDNITAYSLEDTKLWKRHLLYAILQVLGAVYVLYEHVASTSAAYASVLMFAVGAVKYVERTRALMRSNLDTIRGSVRKQPPAMHGHLHPQDRVFKGDELDEESLVRRAHSLFHICKRAIVDYPVISIQEDDDDDDRHRDTAAATTTMLAGVRLWRLMETELSLMYDMLYTKAAVTHTWSGYSVRLISPFAIAGSLLLFIRVASKDDGAQQQYREADVVITYVLYGGAFFMETTSLLNALGSSWTFAFLSTTRWSWLRYTALCNQRWDRLRRLVSCLHHAVGVGGGGGSSPRSSTRRWSRIIGQYNMLHYCTGRSESAAGLFSCSHLLLAKIMGLNEWWNRVHYSWDIEMPDHVKDRISKHMNKVYTEGASINSLGMLRNRWGEEPLVRNNLFQDILKDSLGVEFQECIIIWHIGTDVFLAKSQRRNNNPTSANDDVEAIKVISNYMMFLLVEQPDMLPGLSQNRLYQRTCDNLVLLSTRRRRTTTHHHHHSRHNNNNLWAKIKNNLFRHHPAGGANSRVTHRDREEELARAIYDEYESTGFSHHSPRLPYVAKLAKQLLTMEEDGTADSLKLVLDVWTDILVYASNKCSRKAHAEKLNSGGELTTILWLMAEHFYQLYLDKLIQKAKNNNSSEK